MGVVPSFFEVIFLFLFSGTSVDVVSFLEPQTALECLGEKTDTASLDKILVGQVGPGGDDYDPKEATTAIQNLASSSDSIRERAREKLIAMGPAIRPQIEQVAAADPRRAEEAKKVLEKLGALAKSSANRSEVAQLLALRLAGDRKLVGLTSSIEKLRDNPSPFLSQAAREVLAHLKGEEPPKSPTRPWAGSLSIVEALPAATRFLVETKLDVLKAPEQIRVDGVMKGFLAQMGEMGGAGGEEEMNQMLRQATQAIVDVAVKYGNARLDKITLANVGGVGPMGGGLGIVFTGDYQKDVLEQGLLNTPGLSVAQEIEGIKVFSAGGDEVRVACLDNHNVLLLPDDASVGFPVEDYIKAFKAKKKPLRDVPRWDKFLGTLGKGSAARGLALTDETLMSEIYKEMERELPPDISAAIRGMTEIEADISQSEPEMTTYRAEAAFKEPAHATALATFLKSAIEQGVQEIEREMAGAPPAFAPMMEKVRDMMKGIRVVAEGKKGVLRGSIDVQTLLKGFLTPMAVHSSSAPGQATRPVRVEAGP